MPNKKAAMKDLRSSARKRTRHDRVRTNIKQLFKQVEKAIADGDMEKTKSLLIQFQKAADKAVKTHAIPKNRVNRKKSSLMKKASAK